MPTVSRSSSLAAVALAASCLAAVGADQVPPTSVANSSVSVVSNSDAIGNVRPGAPVVGDSAGPWGVLEAQDVYIAAPDWILNLFDVPSAVTKWMFVGMPRADVKALLDEPDVPAVLRRDVSDDARWFQVGDEVQFLPSPEAVLALAPPARARIYGVLARWEANELHHFPYFVPERDVTRWIGDAGLRPELVDAVVRTAYPMGRSLCFSDLPLLVSLSRTHGEARAIIKALSRNRTVLLTLRLDAASDVDKIERYWSGGNANAKDFLPLLESIARAPTIHRLDVVHILPPYARKLCYTYPHPSLAVGGRYPDCHWTCLNFFNYRPEARLFDTEGADRFVQEQYQPGTEPYRFGDVLFFTDAEGNAIHSCIYLADQFVFTKNGSNVVSPWLIMRLSEVVDRYSVRGEPGIRIYRRRE